MTVIHRGGDELSEPEVGVTVGGTVAYWDGTFKNGYGDGSAVQNGWADGVREGRRLRLATGDELPVGEQLVLEWLGAPDGALRELGSTTVPPGG